MREIWFMSGTKTARKFVPVHEIKWDAGLQSVLSAVHAVTCCNLVSQFAGHGKMTAWKTFENNTRPLTGLGYGQLTNDTVDNVEKLVCIRFDPSTSSQRLIKCECFCLIRERPR